MGRIPRNRRGRASSTVQRRRYTKHIQQRHRAALETYGALPLDQRQRNGETAFLVTRGKIQVTRPSAWTVRPDGVIRDAIIKAVAANQVLLISGDTGCGKTTQVPQFLLDEAWSRNKPCRILCTQPRRIAATMVAARVAEERGESLGKTVGYRVMLDRVCGPNTALIYATTGIMLKDLTNV